MHPTRSRPGPWPLLACALLAACAARPPAVATTAAEAPAGLALRAIGTEPGWSVEVDRGERPRMRLALDYGERRFEVAQAEPLAGAAGYRGRSGDGVPVRLEYRRETCSDGMSDREYPARVDLQVGTQRYQGCAEFPVP